MSTNPTADHGPGDVTILLRKVSGGDLEARSLLVDLIYPELKRLAEYRMQAERPNHTLQPSALVNEFFLEIVRGNAVNFRDRTHFLAVASQAMRRFLIDHARAHNAQRRGGGMSPVEFRDVGLHKDPIDALVLDELLQRLAAEEPRMAQVVDMRCFGGLTHAEIGAALGIDERTAKRDWRVARAWLQSQLVKRAAAP
jgi:RNA polymerase sigma-70 factor (ECF subfamily)